VWKNIEKQPDWEQLPDVESKKKREGDMGIPPSEKAVIQ
jgi:hypothetical protein